MDFLMYYRLHIPVVRHIVCHMVDDVGIVYRFCPLLHLSLTLENRVAYDIHLAAHDLICQRFGFQKQIISAVPRLQGR